MESPLEESYRTCRSEASGRRETPMDVSWAAAAVSVDARCVRSERCLAAFSGGRLQEMLYILERVENILSERNITDSLLGKQRQSESWRRHYYLILQICSKSPKQVWTVLLSTSAALGLA
jgi:hypothetical protein